MCWYWQLRDYFPLWNEPAHIAVMFSDVQLHCDAGKNKRKPDQQLELLFTAPHSSCLFLAPWLSTDRDLRLSDVATPPSCHEFATCQHNISEKLESCAVKTLLSLHPGHQHERPEVCSEGSSRQGRVWLSLFAVLNTISRPVCKVIFRRQFSH